MHLGHGQGMTPDPFGPPARNCPPRMSHHQGNRLCLALAALAGPIPESYAACQPLRNVL